MLQSESDQSTIQPDGLLDRITFRAPSLLVTIWGDTIAPTGDAVWLGSLIRLAHDFGLNERVVRTAVFRLQKDGWLNSTQKGRRSYYDLAPAGRHITRAADTRIYGAGAPHWDGDWLTIIAAMEPARAREKLSRELRLQGYGSPVPGVFVRPGGDSDQARGLLKELGAADLAVVFRSGDVGSTDIAGLRNLVARAWDHAAIDQGYEGFLKVFAPLEDDAGRLKGAEAFVLRTLLVHEFRRITLRDPMLPSELLPPGQSGAAARHLAGRIYWLVDTAATDHASGILEGLDGRLSKPGPAHYHRFKEKDRSSTGEGAG